MPSRPAAVSLLLLLLILHRPVCSARLRAKMEGQSSGNTMMLTQSITISYVRSTCGTIVATVGLTLLVMPPAASTRTHGTIRNSGATGKIVFKTMRTTVVMMTWNQQATFIAAGSARCSGVTQVWTCMTRIVQQPACPADYSVCATRRYRGSIWVWRSSSCCVQWRSRKHS